MNWKALVLVAGLGLLAHSPIKAQNAPDTTAKIPEAILNEWAKAYRENPVYAGGDAHHQMYLMLPRTIRRTAQGTLTVWVRMIPALDVDTLNYESFRENYVALIEKTGGNPNDYVHYLTSMVQHEVDCAHGTLRTLRIVDYNDQGGVIQSPRVRRDAFEEPVPGSNGERLTKVLCQPKARRTFREVMNGVPQR